MSAEPLTDWEELREATKDVVAKPWKTEKFEVYLRVGDTPAMVAFDAGTARKAASGQMKPLNWRLSQQIRREVNLADESGRLIDFWFDQMETVGDLRE